MNDNKHPFPDREDLTLALLAAENATEAAAELLRYRREGPVCNWPFGDVEVCTLLANAISEAGRIEVLTLAVQPAYSEYRDGLSQLIAAAEKFLSGHCGHAHPTHESRQPASDLDDDFPF